MADNTTVSVGSTVGRMKEDGASTNALSAWQQHTRQLKTEICALSLAYRDPRVPWYARVVAACVIGYAFSPIDLIPDPIPVLGYLDDLVLVPLGIALVLKLIPQPVLAECRAQARAAMARGKQPNWIAAGVIIAVWLIVAALAVAFVLRIIGG